MTKFFTYLFLTTAAIVLVTGCSLTRENVIGKWKEQFGDTLIIDSDNTFLLIKSRLNETSKDSLVDVVWASSSLAGKWNLSKKSVSFKFSDTTMNLGGGCTSYQYWWRFSKKKLVRPWTCRVSTHRFVTITKIEKG
jgi:hypothetical protein